MKNIFTVIFLSACFIIAVTEGCTKEEEQKPQASNNVSLTNNGGNGQQNTAGSTSSGTPNNNKPNPSGNNNNPLPAGHPAGTPAACGSCHKGFKTFPDTDVDFAAFKMDEYSFNVITVAESNKE